MIKALLLIFLPVPAWERIVRAQRGVMFILTLFLLPLLAVTSAVEGYGLVHWGKRQYGVDFLRMFPPGDTIIYEAGQLLLSLAVVFIGAKIIRSLGETFHGRHTFTQAFTTVAYGLSPLFLLRMLDACSGVNPWLSWGIGIVLSMGALYHGVPRVMQPDLPHAFGLFLTSLLLLAMTTALMRFVTAWYLQGRFQGVETVIHHFGSRLPI